MAEDRTPHLTLRLSPMTQALVATACRERQVNASELVEAALVALLSSAEHSVQHRLAHMEKALGAIVRLLEAQATPATPTVASYEQLYGPIEPDLPGASPTSEPPLSVAPVRRGRFRRWLTKEGA